MHVSTPGGRIFYSVRGDGPACLVPSAVGTAPYERMLPPALSERVSLVFVDLRGGGQSEGDASTLGFDDIAQDLDAVRRDLGLERVALLGHSIVGAVAIECARRRPQSFARVVAVGAPPIGDMAAVAAAAEAFFAEDASEERRGVLRANLAALTADAPLGQRLRAQAPLRFFDPRLDSGPLYAEATLRPVLMQRLLGPLAGGWDVSAEGQAERPPLLLIHGRCDYVVPARMWDGRVPPEATFTIFERSSHHPFVDEPERFADAVAAWLAA